MVPGALTVEFRRDRRPESKQKNTPQPLGASWGVLPLRFDPGPELRHLANDPGRQQRARDHHDRFARDLSQLWHVRPPIGPRPLTMPLQ